MFKEEVRLHQRRFDSFLIILEVFTGFTHSTYMDIETPGSMLVTELNNGSRTDKVNNGNSSVRDTSLSWFSQGKNNDLRQRAKNVLRELFPLKIRFSELVNEGIEPKLLAELYAEIGIELPLSLPDQSKVNGIESNSKAKDRRTSDQMDLQLASSKALQATSSHHDPADAQRDSSRGDPAPESAQAMHQSILKSSPDKVAQSSFSSNKISVTQNEIQDEPHTQISNPISLTTNKRPIYSAKAAKAPATALLGKPTTAKSGEKALERKDYIARMLAAKAGKPIPALSSSHSTENTTNQPQEIPSKPEPKNQPQEVPSKPELPNQLQEVPSKPGSPNQSQEVPSKPDLQNQPQENPFKPDSTKSQQDIDLSEQQRLLIGNLSYRATESDLKGFFSAFLM